MELGPPCTQQTGRWLRNAPERTRFWIPEAPNPRRLPGVWRPSQGPRDGEVPRQVRACRVLRRLGVEVKALNYLELALLRYRDVLSFL